MSEFGFAEIKKQIERYPHAEKWNLKAVEQALADNRITEEQHRLLSSLLHIVSDKKLEVAPSGFRYTVPIVGRFENVFWLDVFLQHGYHKSSSDRGPGKEGLYEQDGRLPEMHKTYEDTATLNMFGAYGQFSNQLQRIITRLIDNYVRDVDPSRYDEPLDQREWAGVPANVSEIEMLHHWAPFAVKVRWKIAQNALEPLGIDWSVLDKIIHDKNQSIPKPKLPPELDAWVAQLLTNYELPQTVLEKMRRDPMAYNEIVEHDVKEVLLSRHPEWGQHEKYDFDLKLFEQFELLNRAPWAHRHDALTVIESSNDKFQINFHNHSIEDAVKYKFHDYLDNQYVKQFLQFREALYQHAKDNERHIYDHMIHNPEYMLVLCRLASDPKIWMVDQAVYDLLLVFDASHLNSLDNGTYPGTIWFQAEPPALSAIHILCGGKDTDDGRWVARYVKQRLEAHHLSVPMRDMNFRDISI